VPTDASLARRAAAALYESMLLAALALFAGFLLAPFVSPQVPGTPHALVLPSAAGRLTEFVALFALAGAYCVYGWSGGRRTLPQKTWRLALRDGRDAPPTPARAFVRYLACWIGPALALALHVALRPYGLGAHAAWVVLLNWLWAFVDHDRRFLHDRVAGTRIVAVI